MKALKGQMPRTLGDHRSSLARRLRAIYDDLGKRFAVHDGVSPWTARGLEAAGILRRVCVPLPGGRDLRKLLFDRADLDKFVEVCKET